MGKSIESERILKSLTRNLDKLNALGRGYNLDSRYVAISTGKVYLIKGEEEKHYLVSEMQPFLNNSDYLEYVLTNKDSVKKHIMGQIAICGTFQDKPKGKEYVNHKDGVRTNNKNSNLKWVNLSENMKHSYDILKRKPTNQYMIKK